MATLTNSFHGSSYSTNLDDDEINRRRNALNNPDYRGADLPAIKTWGHKVFNALCGIDDCTCGNVIGER
jgi:hypothetical protein